MSVDKSRNKDDIMKMMQGFPPAANHQVLLANWREPDIARWSFNHLRQWLPTAPMRPSNSPAALIAAPQNLDSLCFLDARVDRQQLFTQLKRYLTRSRRLEQTDGDKPPAQDQKSP